ncbi:MAG: NADH-quinone oxidoreductase subunit NuoH [bacterium]|nr:NADH-quinone oxidoreductase subunit NuoH [bacterium]
MNELLLLILEKAGFAVILFSAIMGLASYATLAERRIASWMQDRIGPNRAGPWGLLQPAADGIKFFLKEEMIPANVHKIFYIIAPGIAAIPPILLTAAIPWGNKIILFGREISLQMIDVNAGLLFVFAFASIGIYGVMLGGWASNNKFSLMGSLRASSQVISYELAQGTAVVGVLLLAGTLSLREIVEQQDTFAKWYIWRQPIGFFIFFVASLAECARMPFDLPESENELVGGYHTEYSSMKFGLFQVSEYIHMIVASSLMATLYLGGWQVPFMTVSAQPTLFESLLGVGAIVTKTLLFIFVFMWLRWTLPRFRYDQLMRLGWKVLLEGAFIWVIITAILVLAWPFYTTWF